MLHQKQYWIPKVGGNLSGTLKIMQVLTTDDATSPSSFSTVVGQIHSSEGHANETLKIYYKKFPGHTKGSVSWNYEINTVGSNSGRFDYSTAVRVSNFAEVGTASNVYPAEPKNGIELG